MPDINSYSLSIQLDFQSNAAPVLDEVSAQLTKIEEQISQISSNFSSVLGASASGLSDTTDQIASSMRGVHDTLDQSQPIMEDMLDMREQEKDELEEILDHHTKIQESFEKHLTDLEKSLDPIKEINNGVGDANDSIGDMGVGLGKAVGKTNDLAAGFFKVFLSIEAVKAAFAEVVALEEDFTSVSYRLYGAQHEILGQVNDISTEYGILRETAHEAMKSLGISLRVPRDELSKYAAQVAMFHTITGASIQSTADWQRSMIAAGFSTRDSERSLLRMVLMMEKAGLTTEQINAQLKQEADISTLLFNNMGKEGVDAYQDMAAANIVLTKAVGGDVEAMQRINEALVTMPNFADRIRNIGYERLKLKPEELLGLTEMEIGFRQLEEGMFGFAQQLQEISDSSADPAKAAVAMEEAFRESGQSGKDMQKMLQIYNNLLDQGIDSAYAAREAFGDLRKEIDDAAEFQRQYNEAMAELGKTWREETQPLFMALMNLLIALKPAFMFLIQVVGLFIDVLTWLVDSVTAVVNLFGVFDDKVEETAKSGEDTVGFFKRLTDGLTNFGKAFPGILVGLAIFAGLYVALKLVTRLFTDFVNKLKPANLLALAAALWAMGVSSLMMAGALAIIASLGWRAATALLVLAAAVTVMVVAMKVMATAANSVSMPLLKLAGIMIVFGIAAVMMAASIWVIADAMKMMADMGWGLIGAVVAVIVVLAAMAAVLVVVGYIAAPVAPVILAIGLAFLMMGAAMWLAAKGFEIIIDSMIKLGETSLETANSALILATAVGIIAASLVAFAAVSPAIGLLTVALGSLWLAMKSINVDRVGEVGYAFRSLGTGAGRLATALKALRGVSIKDTLDDIADSVDSALDKLNDSPTDELFGGIASSISSAMDDIERQAARADAIAGSFVRMNEAIANVLSGPQDAVYNDVSNALRGQIDAIETQAARAEALYGPMEKMAAQAELASALGGEPAPDGLAEPVSGSAGPDEDNYMEVSNFIQLRRQTELLEKIHDNAITEVMTKALDDITSGFSEKMEAVKDAIIERFRGGDGPGENDAPL